MIREPLTDLERRQLIELAMKALPKDAKDDPDLTAELVPLIAKLSGADTLVIAYRAYPSRAP